MAKAKKRAWKSYKKMTPYETAHANNVGEMMKHNIDPLSVVMQGSGRGYRLTTLDIANHYETVKRPYDVVIDAFKGVHNHEPTT